MANIRGAVGFDSDADAFINDTSTITSNVTFGTNDFSVIFWWKANTGNDAEVNPIIFASNGSLVAPYRNDSYYMSFITGGLAQFTLFQGATIAHSINTKYNYSNGTTYHTCVSRNNGNVSLYENGELTNATDWGVSLHANSTNFTFSSSRAGLRGLLGGFGVYGKALNSTECQDHYNSGNGITYRTSIAPNELRLNYPADNQNLSTSTITFSLIGIDDADSTGLNVSLRGNWSGAWHLNTSNTSALNNTQTNFSVSVIPDGKYIYSGEVTDTDGLILRNTTNYTFTVDTTSPQITINNPTGTRTNQNVSFNFTITDATSGVSICRYNVTNNAETQTLVANTYITCTDLFDAKTIADGTNHKVNVFANDSLGNYNVTQGLFSVDTSGSGGGGGGGGGGTVTEISVVALIKLNDTTKTYTNLDRAKLYKVVLTYCENSTKKCSSNEDKLDNLTLEINIFYKISIDKNMTKSWIQQFQNEKIENVKVSKTDAEIWALVSAEVIVLESDFQVFPSNPDSFWISLSSSVTKEYNSNRILKSCKIENGDAGFSCSVADTTTIIGYALTDSDFTFKTVNVKVSYVSIDNKVAFQNIRIRIIRLTPTLIVILLGIFSLALFIFGKKVMKSFSKNIAQNIKKLKK